MDKKKKVSEKPPIKYWLVELTLTSSDVRTFYVKARNQFEANEKADEYLSLAGNKQLFDLVTSKFRLLP